MYTFFLVMSRCGHRKFNSRGGIQAKESFINIYIFFSKFYLRILIIKGLNFLILFKNRVWILLLVMELLDRSLQ